MLVTPEDPVVLEVFETPSTTIQSQGFHTFGCEGTQWPKVPVLEEDLETLAERVLSNVPVSICEGSKVSVLEEDLEIPAERVLSIVPVSICEGSKVAVLEEDLEILAERILIDVPDLMCEEAAGFKTSPPEGDQEILQERVLVNDQWKHTTCTTTTDTLGLQESGCEGAPGFSASTVEADARCMRVPSGSNSSGIGPADVLRSRSGSRIDDSGKHGFPICKSAATVIAGTTTACALQYAVLPNANPLHHQDKSGWWYCPLNCTLIWMPNCIAYIGIMLDQFLFAETGVQLTYLDLFLLWLVGSVTMDSLLIILSWTSPWYPFPLASLIAAPAAFACIAIGFGLCIYPRLRRAVPENEAREVAVKTLLVFVIFMLSICLMLLLLLLLALLGRIVNESLKVLLVLFTGSLREVCRAGTEKITVLLNPEAAIIGQNLTMACFGVGFLMIVGNSSSILLTGVVVLQDIVRGMMVGIMVGDVFIGQFNLSVFLLEVRPASWFKLCTRTGRSSTISECEFQRKSSRSTLRSNLIASETGEVILPIAYVCSWLAVRFGPYKSSFTGIGTGDYGIDPPEKISSFVMFTIILIVFEALAVMILMLSLRYFLGVAISFDEHYRKFGKLLTVQNIWVVHTCFCVMMISCGFDYSLQWESPQE